MKVAIFILACLAVFSCTENNYTKFNHTNYNHTKYNYTEYNLSEYNYTKYNHTKDNYTKYNITLENYPKENHTEYSFTEYNYTVSSDCSSFKCRKNSRNAKFTTNLYVCPKAGSNAAVFRKIPTTNELFLDFTPYNMFSNKKKVSFPLIFNPSFNSTGLQYNYTHSNGE